MQSSVDIASVILTGFMVGAFFHICTWVMTYGLRLLDDVLK